MFEVAKATRAEKRQTKNMMQKRTEKKQEMPQEELAKLLYETNVRAVFAK
jgi:hypothetical protein